MSAKDFFHNAVRLALEKDGWLITAQKGNQKIAVEVKSFIGLSAISEFHTAIGQFLNYKVVLTQKDP